MEPETRTKASDFIEETLSVESHLNRAEVLEISDFLSSDTVKTIGESIAVPHIYIDYMEAATVSFTGQDTKGKRISIFDFGLNR